VSLMGAHACARAVPPPLAAGGSAAPANAWLAHRGLRSFVCGIGARKL